MYEAIGKTICTTTTTGHYGIPLSALKKLAETENRLNGFDESAISESLYAIEDKIHESINLLLSCLIYWTFHGPSGIGCNNASFEMRLMDVLYRRLNMDNGDIMVLSAEKIAGDRLLRFVFVRTLWIHHLYLLFHR